METHIIDGRAFHVLDHGNDTTIYLGQQKNCIAKLKEITSRLNTSLSYTIVGYEVPDWFDAFSPWPCTAGGRTFAGEGEKTLLWLMEKCMPFVEKKYSRGKKRMITGYSLAGLFSLWAFYKTGEFYGVASCSGSLWYPGWKNFVESFSAKNPGIVYLSLGAKEENTRNPLMSSVGEMTR